MEFGWRWVTSHRHTSSLLPAAILGTLSLESPSSGNMKENHSKDHMVRTWTVPGSLPLSSYSYPLSIYGMCEACTVETMTENLHFSQCRVLEPRAKQYIYNTSCSPKTQGSLHTKPGEERLQKSKEQEVYCHILVSRNIKGAPWSLISVA